MLWHGRGVKNIKSILDSEEAVIARWFSDSPYGLLFHGDDGRSWRIRPEEAALWKGRATTALHQFVADSKSIELLSILVAGGLAVLAAWIAHKLGFDGTITGFSAIGTAMSAMHLLPFLRLYRFRQQQKKLRAEIVASLGMATPLPEDAARPYRRRNIWYGAMYGVVFLMIAYAVTIERFSHGATFSSVDPAAATTSGVTPLRIVAPMVVGLGLAWLFYFRAKAFDRQQR